ncbi:MAG: hypothetical protein ACRDQA_01040 [Nocardioidaceae bacterium]
MEYPDPGVPPVTEAEVAEALPKIDAVIDAAARVLDSMPAWS